MITTLKLIASCEVLGLEFFFERICFGHAFLKACQYVTTTIKFAKTWNMYLSSYTIIFLNNPLNPKKSRKIKQELNRTCVNFGLMPRKLLLII